MRVRWRGASIVCLVRCGAACYVALVAHASDAIACRAATRALRRNICRRECVTCHQLTRPIRRHSADRRLAGARPSSQIMKEYRDKRARQSRDADHRRRLSDDEIAALAAYFGSLKPQTKRTINGRTTMTDLDIADNFSRARRRFAGALATLAVRPPCSAQAKPKVVVVGGGPGGATVARYVAKDSDGAIEVTLVEPQQQLHHLLPLQPLSRRLSATSSRSPIPTTSVTQARRQARPRGGGRDRPRQEDVRARRRHALPYDRLVVAPGIDIKFDSVPGYSEAASRRSCRMPGSPGRRRNC